MSDTGEKLYRSFPVRRMNTIKHTQLHSHVASHEEVNREPGEVKETSVFYPPGLLKVVDIQFQVISTEKVSVPRSICIFSRAVLYSVKAYVSLSSGLHANVS